LVPVDLAHLGAALQRDVARRAFGEQHVDDLPRRSVAEQLPERLLVPGDAVALHQREEVLRGVPAQRRLGEMGIGRDEPVGRRMDIGEVAAPAARDQDLLPRRVGAVEHQHPQPALPRLRRAHQPGGSGPQHYRVVSAVHLSPALTRKAGGSLRRPSIGLRHLRSSSAQRGSAGDYAPSTSATSIFRPGPIDELSATFLTYLPLAPAGFALTIASVSALKLVLSWSSVKLILPIPEWMMPCLSTRNSTWPPLASFTACATFGVTVPSLGFGIRPFGPSSLPSRPTTPIMSGVAITRS